MNSTEGLPCLQQDSQSRSSPIPPSQDHTHNNHEHVTPSDSRHTDCVDGSGGGCEGGESDAGGGCEDKRHCGGGGGGGGGGESGDSDSGDGGGSDVEAKEGATPADPDLTFLSSTMSRLSAADTTSDGGTASSMLETERNK